MKVISKKLCNLANKSRFEYKNYFMTSYKLDRNSTKSNQKHGSSVKMVFLGSFQKCIERIETNTYWIIINQNDRFDPIQLIPNIYENPKSERMDSVTQRILNWVGAIGWIGRVENLRFWFNSYSQNESFF